MKKYRQTESDMRVVYYDMGFSNNIDSSVIDVIWCKIRVGIINEISGQLKWKLYNQMSEESFWKDLQYEEA